ncbi:hypothetical protein ACFL14_00900 [Patescibacteria group bacterium]
MLAYFWVLGMFLIGMSLYGYLRYQHNIFSEWLFGAGVLIAGISGWVSYITGVEFVGEGFVKVVTAVVILLSIISLLVRFVPCFRRVIID